MLSEATLYTGDALFVLKTLPDESVQCCVTSPPYWGLRDYGTATWEGGDAGCDHKVGRFETPCSDKQRSNSESGDVQAAGVCPKCGARRIDAQLGLEESPEAYVAKMVEVFREVKRVLRRDGTLWLNIGSSYFTGRDDMMALRSDLSLEEEAFVLSELAIARRNSLSTQSGRE
jgi:site-specific DNA-methyltransferase (cytosine-N4-specific)